MKMPPIARHGLAEARRWLLQRVAPEGSLGRTLLATTRNSVLAWRLAAADRAATSIPFDDIYDREQWRTLLAAHRCPGWRVDPAADSAGAAGFVIEALLRNHGQEEFPRALSAGPAGPFARWLIEGGAGTLAAAAIQNVRAVFSEVPGERVLRHYDFDEAQHQAHPLALTPRGRLTHLHWLLVPERRRRLGFGAHHIAGFVLQAKEDETAGVVPTYLRNREWQGEVPDGLGRGYQQLRAWAKATYGLKRKRDQRPRVGPWARLTRSAWTISRTSWPKSTDGARSRQVFDFVFEHTRGLAGVTRERVGLGRAHEARVDRHMFTPVETDLGERRGDRVGHAGRNDVVVGCWLLEHQPPRAHGVARVPPVAARIEVAEGQPLCEPEVDASDLARDLARHELEAAARRLVVFVHDAARGGQGVHLTVVARQVIARELGDRVGRARPKAGRFVVRCFADSAEHLARGGEVEAAAWHDRLQRGEQAVGRRDVAGERVERLVQRAGDIALGGEVVALVRVQR